METTSTKLSIEEQKIINEEIKAYIDAAFSRRESQKIAEPFIKGIHELAKFLRVSPAKAQKLKNEGVFEFWQDGRTVLFDPNKVRAAMNKQTK